MIFSWPVLRYFTLENFGNWPAIADFVFRFFQLHRRRVSWWGALKLVYFLGVLWDAFFILVSFFGAARFLAATLFATFFFARELDFLASITVATLPKTALTTVVLAALAVAAAVAAASATSPANHLASSAALFPAATTVSCTLVIMGFFASIAVATLSKTTPAAAVLAALSALAPSAALFPAAIIAPCALVLIPLLVIATPAWLSSSDLRSNYHIRPMSALGQKQTFDAGSTMSALPPIADIAPCRHVHAITCIFAMDRPARIRQAGD
jgi:hypothetical protein